MRSGEHTQGRKRERRSRCTEIRWGDSQRATPIHTIGIYKCTGNGRPPTSLVHLYISIVCIGGSSLGVSPPYLCAYASSLSLSLVCDLPISSIDEIGRAHTREREREKEADAQR